ncbi:MAG: protease complex subunit PrcB family protein [Bacillota bacterium]
MAKWAVRRFLLLLLLALAGCGRTAAALEFQTLARGYHSGITAREAVLITDRAAWESHWRRHAAIFMPPPPPPPVDFAEGAVVSVHLGERRSGGYGVAITGVRLEGGRLVVTAVESRPEPGAVVTMALTQPYQMVRIPRVKPGTRLQVEWLAGDRGRG